jgi:hypothetical protein
VISRGAHRSREAHEKQSGFRLTLCASFDVIDARRRRVSEAESVVFAGKFTGEQLFFC